MSSFRNETASAKKKYAKGRNRTGDTALFRRVLYQLSYLGTAAGRGEPPSFLCAGAVPSPQMQKPPVRSGGFRLSVTL